jgi:hypothetical protein
MCAPASAAQTTNLAAEIWVPAARTSKPSQCGQGDVGGRQYVEKPMHRCCGQREQAIWGAFSLRQPAAAHDLQPHLKLRGLLLLLLLLLGRAVAGLLLLRGRVRSRGACRAAGLASHLAETQTHLQRTCMRSVPPRLRVSSGCCISANNPAKARARARTGAEPCVLIQAEK